jgi:hypothetical protein
MKSLYSVLATSGLALVNGFAAAAPSDCNALVEASVVMETKRLISAAAIAANEANAAPAVPWNYIYSVDGLAPAFQYFLDAGFINLAHNPLSAPQVAVVMGYGLNWNVAHSRYWTGLHVWNNRAGSPTAELIAPSTGKKVIDSANEAQRTIQALHAHVEKLNAHAEACMKDEAW